MCTSELGLAPGALYNHKHAVKLIFVLPAFNEAENIAALLQAVQTAMEQSQLAYRIVLVDDGSTDNTLAVAQAHGKNLPLVVARNIQNEGLASALRKGFLKAAELATVDDVIVTMDADNSHKPEQVPTMLAALQAEVDVVIASRFVLGAEIHGLRWTRQLLSSGASLVFRLCFPISGIRDYTCGYRLIRSDLLRHALALYGPGFVSERGFSCIVDTLLKLHKLGARGAEVPLVLRYDLKRGQSKMRIGRTTCATLWLLLRRRCNVGVIRS